MPSDPKALGHEDTEKALERAKNLTEGRRLSMQERQEQWLAKKAEKAAKLQAEKEERENASCSFMPKIKKTTSTRLRRPSVEIPPTRRPSVVSGQPVTLESLPVVSPGGTVIKDAQGREPGSPSKRRVSIDPAAKKGPPTQTKSSQDLTSNARAAEKKSGEGKKSGGGSSSGTAPSAKGMGKRRNTWSNAKTAALKAAGDDAKKGGKKKLRRNSSIAAASAVTKMKAGAAKRRKSSFKVVTASEVKGGGKLEAELEKLREMKRNLDERQRVQALKVLEAMNNKQEKTQDGSAMVIQRMVRTHIAKRNVQQKKLQKEKEEAEKEAAKPKEVQVRVRVTGGGYSGKTGVATVLVSGDASIAELALEPSTKYEVTLDETGKTVFKRGSQIEKRADDDVDVEVVEEAPKSVFLQEEEAEEERQRQAAAAKAAQEKAEEEARIAAEAVVETEEEKHQREMRELKEKVRKQSTEGQDWSQFMGAGKNMVGRSAK